MPTAPQRLRLLVLASTYPAGPDDATPGFVRDLARQEAAEFDTLVLVPRLPGTPAAERDGALTVQRFRYFPRRWEDLADGAILENLRRRRSRWLQVVPFLAAETYALRRAVRRHEPDVLHLHWILPQGLAALVAARKVPWLVTTHGGEMYGLTGPLARRAMRAVLRRADAVTVVNDDLGRRVELLTGTAPEVLPMGADVDAVRAGAGDRVPGRLLVVGRLVEKKGVGVLLDAVRGLDRPGWSLEVVGDGPLRAELERAAAGLPVVFRGALPRAGVSAALSRADVVAVPSVPASTGDQDGLPVTLLEAMAAGRAIVASRLPGIDAAVRDGETGVLVPPGDVPALRAAIDALLADPERRTALADAARAHAEQFSTGVAGERYRAVLRRLTDR